MLAAGGHCACVARLEAPWTDPVAALARFADEPYAALLLSGRGGWSYLLRQPDAVGSAIEDLSGLLGPPAAGADDPPFQAGVLGLAAYELSARLEPTAPQGRDPDWPDLTLARYPALVAFHIDRRRVVAIGRGADAAAAETRARVARSWLDAPPPAPPADGPLARTVDVSTPPARHAAAVAHTVARIAAGEIFQANLARPWRGRLAAGRTPFDLFRRLARTSPASYAAYLRLPGRAVVSNSPERFLSVRGDHVETWPIKGTRPRGSDPAGDEALARELLASAKDRAENLMIVDLMRNDLARVCAPGSVEVPELAALRTYANVHHLVSRVRGRLAAGRSAWDAFLAAFPPGSITGAPKLQAMKVIADHEPPRGPYCGSLFWAGLDGALEASVLIRTVALVEDPAGWRFEARAGGGIVADSDPQAETAETEHKISAILAALEGEGP
ncbi:anthranilate synthase component I family protein [Phenylobacterium sp.]|uniref:anthranilate synthase component I family protein n=1 Tax=Phenylobacterium sp. TaxID=1871053 RepID=UPI00281221D6|nr:anthranilate synthase component I family protein [Phenylobacterium sp.]